MLKSLKTFKKPISNKVIERQIVQAEEPDKNQIQVFAHDNNTLGQPNLKLLDQLEKSGYSAIAHKLRDLQHSAGLEELDPLVHRLKLIESHIDSLLQLGCPLDTEELQRLLNMTVQAFQTRTKALLLPYGAVSPRTALNSGKGNSAPVQIAFGIGTAVAPRAKN